MLTDLVSGFQSFAEQLYMRISEEAPKRNLFQRVNDGSAAFESAIGKSYEDIIGDEVGFIQMMFQRRHLLEHKNGLIDEEYIRKSGDTSAVPGQRIVVHSHDLLRLIHLLDSLGSGLKEHAERMLGTATLR